MTEKIKALLPTLRRQSEIVPPNAADAQVRTAVPAICRQTAGLCDSNVPHVRPGSNSTRGISILFRTLSF